MPDNDINESKTNDEPNVSNIDAEKSTEPDLKSTSAKQEDEISDLKDSLLRAQAEIDNIRKRSIKEVQNAYVQSVEQLSSNLLLIIDSLEAASLLAEEKKCSLEDMIEGNNLLLKSTKEMFDRLSITEINPTDEDFDPEFHQAISTEESDIEENKVLKVIQKGFKLPNKLLRPALVVVSKKKS